MTHSKRRGGAAQKAAGRACSAASMFLCIPVLNGKTCCQTGFHEQGGDATLGVCCAASLLTDPGWLAGGVLPLSNPAGAVRMRWHWLHGGLLVASGVVTGGALPAAMSLWRLMARLAGEDPVGGSVLPRLQQRRGADRFCIAGRLQACLRCWVWRAESTLEPPCFAQKSLKFKHVGAGF